MKILVTGGAGYIGSHVVHALLGQGISVVVVDDMSAGETSFIEGVPIYKGSLFSEPEILDTVLSEHPDVDSVIHLAGYKRAGESMQRPLHAYQQNILSTINLLRWMKKSGIDNFVFSSSAAVYGTPTVSNVTEQSDTNPESPYGQSKLVCEWVIKNPDLCADLEELLNDDFFANLSPGEQNDVMENWMATNKSRVEQGEKGSLKFACLRYFNVAGSAFKHIYDKSTFNLFPIVFNKLLGKEPPIIFGNDYQTTHEDNSCVRDYIHVGDLAEAHVAAVLRLAQELPVEPIYNLGCGTGYSVIEVMEKIRQVTNINFTAIVDAPRDGDPAEYVADSTLATRDLCWVIEKLKSVEAMVESGWRSRLVYEKLANPEFDEDAFMKYCEAQFSVEAPLYIDRGAVEDNSATIHANGADSPLVEGALSARPLSVKLSVEFPAQ